MSLDIYTYMYIYMYAYICVYIYTYIKYYIQLLSSSLWAYVKTHLLVGFFHRFLPHGFFNKKNTLRFAGMHYGNKMMLISKSSLKYPKDPGVVCPENPGFTLFHPIVGMGFGPSNLRFFGREIWILRDTSTLH